MRTMVDMSREPADLKQSMKEVAPSQPMYSYGLCLSLDEESLAKLGMDDDMPDVGDLIHLMAMAKVTSVSENQMDTPDGPKRCCRVELQITHLGVEDENREDDAAERAERRYGKKPDDEDEED